ncbi:valine--tRNA ligase, partial [Campylobacter lari]|nr:valine--tRNA ligase [Campylobacter lari]
NIIIESIVSLRRAKTLVELANSKIQKACVKLNDESLITELKNYTNFISTLAKCENIEFISTNLEKSIRDVSENLEVFIPTQDLDLSGVLNRLNSQKTKLDKEFNKLDAMMKNEKFISNAPAAVVEQNKTQLESIKAQLEKINDEISNLEG